jgi:hypothetical protein
LNTSDGYNNGAESNFDKVPRVLSESDQKMLQTLETIVMNETEKA